MVLRHGYRAGIMGLLAAGGLGLSLSRAQAQYQITQNSVQVQNTAPAALLQVTGTETRFTVSANRADAADALKLIFDQAGKQFVLDSSVTGVVTLRLTDQPLSVALTALCRQTFLRYHLDAATGITYFERDDAAVRQAFARLRTLDSALRDQLRQMGLSVPNDAALGSAPQTSFRVPSEGYGGAIVPPPALRSRNGKGTEERTGQQNNALGGPASGASGSSAAKPDATQRALPLPGPAEPGTAGRLSDSSAATLDLSQPGALQQFLLASNFVSVNIPKDKPEPVAGVLKSLGQQAKVNLLIDPDVPNGSKFTLCGSISPRPLPEALNILTRYARLEWRWIGNNVFVTAAPDFQIFYGDDKQPRASSVPQGRGQLLNRSGSPAVSGDKIPPAKPAAPPAPKEEPKKQDGSQ